MVNVPWINVLAAMNGALKRTVTVLKISILQTYEDNT